MREARDAHRLDHRFGNCGLLAIQARGGHCRDIAGQVIIDVAG